MEGFIIAAVIVIWLLLIFVTFVKAIEDSNLLYGIVCFLLIVGLTGSLIQSVIDENEKGPCVEYETQLHYNPAVKTMMPAKVCIKRGEWIEED